MSVQFSFLMDTWEMCSCLHREHFQALGETNPSQTQYLNSPSYFSPFKLRSTAPFHFTNTTASSHLLRVAHGQSIKQSPAAELRITTLGQCLSHCPWRLSADFSIPFSPQPLLKYTELHCFPEDLHLPSTFPHHFWIISLIAFGD